MPDGQRMFLVHLSEQHAAKDSRSAAGAGNHYHRRAAVELIVLRWRVALDPPCLEDRAEGIRQTRIT